MIVTLTANPSVDRTVLLGGPLLRGQVQRGATVANDAGGKGVNVARAVTSAGRPAVAVLPGQHDDPLVTALRELPLTHRAVAVPGRIRVNLTLAEPDGTTTKINEPGMPLDEGLRAAVAQTLLQEAAGAHWVALCGSLPPEVPDDWYADLVVALRPYGCSVAVDTSGAPLTALLDRLGDAAPDLLKPNSEELAEATGADADELENDPAAAAAAARTLLERGVGAVLATLGPNGALLVTHEGTWHARPRPVVARSTVGAGDSTLSGYLLADVDGLDAPGRLRLAVAYGAAAVSLPGTTMPTPGQTDPDGVTVEPLEPSAATGGLPDPAPSGTA